MIQIGLPVQFDMLFPTVQLKIEFADSPGRKSHFLQAVSLFLENES